MLGPLMDRTRNPATDALVGTTASAGVVSIRMRAECPPDLARAVLDRAERDVRAALGPIILDAASSSPLFADASPAADPLALDVLSLLAARSHLLATAESCTGGLLGQILTAIPNSSAVYLGGLVTYHNDAKARLAHVDRGLIAAHGAVSAPVALAMARGTLATLPADHALAITGIAGPSGGSDDKPVGTVWIARASRTAQPPQHAAPAHQFPAEARRFRFAGDRDTIRDMAAKSALGILRQHLLAGHGPAHNTPAHARPSTPAAGTAAHPPTAPSAAPFAPLIAPLIGEVERRFDPA
jgi:PncC family amidohydrolase